MSDDRWTEYWARGALHSLPYAFEGNYARGVAAFWRERFVRLGERARVLDVGTGNGAVALLAVGFAREHSLDFEVHGVDLADIDPGAAVEAETSQDLSRIRFHARTAIEALPFEAGRFDLITGQYAFEYADIEPAARELARVAAPDGRLALGLHHDQSMVMQNARIVCEQGRLIFERLKFFPLLGALLKRVSAAQTPEDRRRLATDPEAERIRHAFNQAAEQIYRAAEQSPNPRFLDALLAESRRCMSAVGKHSLEELERRVAFLEADLRSKWARMDDLAACACDEAGRERILGALQQAGFQVLDSGMLHDETSEGRYQIGWWLDCQLGA